MRSAAALILVLLVAAALPARAATVTFNVDDASEAPDTNTADGVCHTASNTCSLRAALQQATAPSANTFVINLKAATYSVSTTLPTVNTTITIEGTDAATRNIQSASPGHPLLFNVVMGGNLTLDHVTVSNAGHGAISIIDGSASITNSVVTENTQGAVYVNSSQTLSTLVLTNDTFSDNTNAIGPGALEVSFANLVATNVTFQGNTGTVGGVAYLHGSSDYTQTFTGCTFSGNSTIQSGGALWITAPKVTIDTSTFDDNTASGGLYGGGAIYGGGPAPGTLVTNSTFTNNHADNASGGNGGAIFALNVVRATNCTFSGNQSTKGLGGAVFAGANDGAEFDAVNCTFSGNKAAGGGALAGGGASGILKLSNVTIAGNTATDTVAHGFGGGGTYGAMQPRNSIVAGNTSAGGAPDCIGNFVSQGYTLVGNNTDCTVNSVGSGDKIGTGASPIDPHLDSLKDNGGPTATMALLAASPAGDAGDPAGCEDQNGTTIATDQRGQARTLDGNSDGVARCDLGAYEAAVGTFPSSTTTTTSTSTTSTTTTSTSTTTTTRPSTTTTTKPSTTSTTSPSTTTTSTITSTTSTTTSLASTTTTTSDHAATGERLRRV